MDKGRQMIEWNGKILDVNTGKEMALIELWQRIADVLPEHFQSAWLDDEGTIRVGDVQKLSRDHIMSAPTPYAAAFQPAEPGKTTMEEDCDFILYALIHRRYQFDCLCDEIWRIFQRKAQLDNK